MMPAARVALLLTVGIVLVAVGILLGTDQEAVAIALIAIGAGQVTMGVLLPRLSEFEIGPGGLKAKLRERDAEVTPIIEQDGERLGRLAAFLAASPADAPQVAQEALAETYAELRRTADPAGDARRRVVEAVREQASEPGPKEAGRGRADPWGRVAGALAELSPDNRAAVVLRVVEGMEERRIADLLGIPGAAVEDAMAAAERKLTPATERGGA